MAFSKKEHFNLLPQLVADMSKPFCHPARVKITMQLLEHGVTPFNDLMKTLPLHQSTISQHIRLMGRSRLLLVQERPPHTYYDLNKDELRKHMMVIGQFLDLLREHGIDPKDLNVFDE